MGGIHSVVLGLPVRPGAVGMKIADAGYLHVNQQLPVYELMFVREGCLSMQVGGERLDIHAGETLLIWPGEEYGGAEPVKGHLQYYFLHFDVSGGRSKSGDQLPLGRKARAPRPDRLTALFHLLLDDQASRIMDSLSSRLLVAQILVEAGEAAAVPQVPADAANVLMERCKAYIRQNADQPLTTRGIARALDVSPRYLGRAFRRAAGYSVTEFILIARVHRSRMLMIESDLSIKQIAHVCGFESYSYFSRAFRKREGVSPREYRRLHSRAYTF